MAFRLGVVMDPIGSLKVYKDSTYAMIREAQARGWQVEYMEQGDLFLRDAETYARLRTVTLQPDAQPWFTLGPPRIQPIGELDALLMRKDPPFDLEYIYTTYLLERAELRHGLTVVNRPQALRDANEKIFASNFPQCTPPTLVTRRGDLVREFLNEHQDIVVKPLDAMGGASVFHIRHGDPNTSVILELMTQHDSRALMAQRYIPEIKDGDKRILLIDGEPVPYALARIPAPGETRGNLAAGARGEARPLTERDRWICAQVGPVLRERGILFAGLDVIGNYLTEVNVTSPTGIRELDAAHKLNIAARLLDAVAAHAGVSSG